MRERLRRVGTKIPPLSDAVRGGGEQFSAVAGEGDDVAGILEAKSFAHGPHIPNSYRVVTAPSGHQTSVRRKGEIADLLRLQIPYFIGRIGRFQVPEPDRAVAAASGQEFPVGRESERPDRTDLAVESFQFLSRGRDLPELDGFVGAAGRESPAVG